MKDEQKSLPRPRGRPRVEEPRSYPVTTWLPVRDHDRLMRLALERGESVSATIREVIILTLK